MVNINNDFNLSDKNYFSETHKKKQIVIGNTSSTNMNHIDLWSKKMNGAFKGTSAYTIGLDGKIYNHYNPKYYSNFLKIKDYDKSIISIVLENEGWLVKDFDDKTLINWSGDIYSKDDSSTINIKWRGKLRWAPYSEEQLNSLVELCKYLADQFDIPLISSHFNTKIDDVHEKEGIYYKSNYSKNYLDVSPAFNFGEFKEKIEK